MNDNKNNLKRIIGLQSRFQGKGYVLKLVLSIEICFSITMDSIKKVKQSVLVFLRFYMRNDITNDLLPSIGCISPYLKRVNKWFPIHIITIYFRFALSVE